MSLRTLLCFSFLVPIFISGCGKESTFSNASGSLGGAPVSDVAEAPMPEVAEDGDYSGGSDDSFAKTASPNHSETAEHRLAMPVSQRIATPPSPTRPKVDTTGETYSEIIESGFKSVSQNPRSTFSIDVDTAAYSNVRRFLESGQLPPANAVRVEELINYFTYDDKPPTDGRPFSVHTEVAQSPWNSQRQIVRIGLKGQEVERAERQPANLVFLVDVSGSMRPENKLPLVKRSLHRLLEELGDRDRVAIVTYASGVRTILPPTAANQQHRISQAIDSLNAGGSTNGSAGLQMAYQVARQQYVEFGTNRVFLCSDGDFNAGITREQDLIQLISQEAKSGVFLSVLGFGTGNYRDSIAEKLADHGNGNYAYIDSYSEARKVLIDQMTGTLETIAKDVKIQVEFNPANVAAYRLIGYENRTLAARDFRDDKKDAGEIGAGHSVTALYEVVPVGAEIPDADVPELRYQKPKTEPGDEHGHELLTVRLRYKLPSEDQSIEFAHAVENKSKPFRKASEDLRFATSVATFGMILRDSQFAQHLSWGDVRNWAQASLGQDEKGYRTEFLNLVAQAEQLVHRPYRADEVSSYYEQQMFVQPPQVTTLQEHVSGIFQTTDSGKVVTILVIIGVSYGISTLRNVG